MKNYWSRNGIGVPLRTGSSLITEFESRFANKLMAHVPDKHIVINTTWFSDEGYCSRLKQWTGRISDEKVWLLSGMDWENTQCTDQTKEMHKFLSDHYDTEHIGNTGDGHYFSFWISFIKFYRDYFFNDEYLTKPDFKYHFMSLNRKCNDHRAYLLNKIFNDGLDRVGNISVIESDDRYNFEHPRILSERHPVYVKMLEDWEQVSNEHISNDIISLGDPAHWNSHFVNVVTESTTHSDVFISEKTFKPLIGLRPYVIIGDENIYRKLRTWGVDTFEDVFPNSNKDEPDYEKRCENVVKDLNNIAELNLTDVEKLYESLKSRLYHNRDRVLGLFADNERWIEELYGKG